jgi:RNA polymerase sigma factor (TIGR02999 family)
MNDDHEITDLLAHLDGAPREVVDRVFPLVYHELKAIAAARLRAEREEHTLTPTALVHEAYLKLVDQRTTDWKNRAQFFAIAARAMRRILLDHAIARRAQKRGGGEAFVTLADDAAGRESNADQLIELDDAMTRLAGYDTRQAQIVELRFFGGLTLEDIAGVLRLSLSSVNRDWRAARAFLSTQLAD